MNDSRRLLVRVAVCTCLRFLQHERQRLAIRGAKGTFFLRCLHACCSVDAVCLRSPLLSCCGFWTLTLRGRRLSLAIRTRAALSRGKLVSDKILDLSSLPQQRYCLCRVPEILHSGVRKFRSRNLRILFLSRCRPSESLRER